MSFNFPVNSNEKVPVLYGTETKLGNCIGYCHHHHTYVTPVQAKPRQCYSCKHMQRYEPSVAQKKAKREAQRQSKNLQANLYNEKINFTQNCLKIYAESKNISVSKAYNRFDSVGLISKLKTQYEDFKDKEMYEVMRYCYSVLSK